MKFEGFISKKRPFPSFRQKNFSPLKPLLASFCWTRWLPSRYVANSAFSTLANFLPSSHAPIN